MVQQAASPQVVSQTVSLDPGSSLAAHAFNPRTFLHAFAHWASGGKWKQYRHLVHTGTEITRAVYAKNSRVIINLPPRVGKSEMLCFWLPVFFLEWFPHKRVILGTHSQPLATRFGRMVRNELNTNPLLKTKVSDDSAAKDEWETTAGGGMKCVGVGTGVTGFGADLLLIDDPYPSWSKAWSASYRAEVEQWYDGTANNRLEPGASVIVLHHRMHPKDLTHYLLSKDEQWDHVSLPSIAKPGDPMGRKEGEALCPERYDSERLVRVKRATPSTIFDAMHQQNPTSVGPGAAYHGFSDKNLVACQPILGLPLHISIDFNRTPNMHALIGQYDPRADRFFVYAELTESRRVIDTAAELCAWIRLRGGWGKAGFTELHIFGDASGNTKSTQTGAADYSVLRRCIAKEVPDRFIRLRVPASNPPIVDRVATFNDALCDIDGECRYAVHPGCDRLITDFRELTMTDDGKPDEQADTMLGHASAAEGYRVHYLRPVGGRRVVKTGRVITA